MDCRIDHYQTPTEIHVSVFAKQADKERSAVKIASNEVGIYSLNAVYAGLLTILADCFRPCPSGLQAIPSLDRAVRIHRPGHILIQILRH